MSISYNFTKDRYEVIDAYGRVLSTHDTLWSANEWIERQ